jgi:hypothetical protein
VLTASRIKPLLYASLGLMQRIAGNITMETLPTPLDHTTFLRDTHILLVRGALQLLSPLHACFLVCMPMLLLGLWFLTMFLPLRIACCVSVALFCGGPALRVPWSWSVPYSSIVSSGLADYPNRSYLCLPCYRLVCSSLSPGFACTIKFFIFLYDVLLNR